MKLEGQNLIVVGKEDKQIVLTSLSLEMHE